jgi:hypothetical protein
MLCVLRVREEEEEDQQGITKAAGKKEIAVEPVLDETVPSAIHHLCLTTTSELCVFICAPLSSPFIKPNIAGLGMYNKVGYALYY